MGHARVTGASELTPVRNPFRRTILFDVGSTPNYISAS
jgi:hypothetical protein